jgi:hypothetical protein
MFAVQFGVIADYTLRQALFTVAIFALVAIKNTLAIWMKTAIILGYHGGCRVLKKCFAVKDRAHFVRRVGHRAWSIEEKILARLAPCQCKVRVILQDHFDKLVYNICKTS